MTIVENKKSVKLVNTDFFYRRKALFLTITYYHQRLKKRNKKIDLSAPIFSCVACF